MSCYNNKLVQFIFFVSFSWSMRSFFRCYFYNLSVVEFPAFFEASVFVEGFVIVASVVCACKGCRGGWVVFDIDNKMLLIWVGIEYFGEAIDDLCVILFFSNRNHTLYFRARYGAVM